MTYKIEYISEKERLELINLHKDKFLIQEEILIEGNFLTFSDEEPPLPIEKQLEKSLYNNTNKISILEGENEKLKQEQEQQNEEILVNMLANTEMFEMILGMIPMTLSIDEKNTKNNGGNSMIEVYCTLIIKGVKTIEDVPLVIREQVVERLKQLEVPVK